MGEQHIISSRNFLNYSGLYYAASAHKKCRLNHICDKKKKKSLLVLRCVLASLYSSACRAYLTAFAQGGMAVAMQLILYAVVGKWRVVKSKKKKKRVVIDRAVLQVAGTTACASAPLMLDTFHAWAYTPSLRRFTSQVYEACLGQRCLAIRAKEEHY